MLEKKGKCSLMCHTQIAGVAGRSNNPFAAFLFSLLYHPASGWGKNLFFLISYSSSSIFYPTRWCCNKHHGPFTFPSRFSTLVINRFSTLKNQKKKWRFFWAPSFFWIFGACRLSSLRSLILVIFGIGWTLVFCRFGRALLWRFGRAKGKLY